jgi:hypothetical protein
VPHFGLSGANSARCCIRRSNTERTVDTARTRLAAGGGAPSADPGPPRVTYGTCAPRGKAGERFGPAVPKFATCPACQGGHMEERDHLVGSHEVAPEPQWRRLSLSGRGWHEPRSTRKGAPDRPRRQVPHPTSMRADATTAGELLIHRLVPRPLQQPQCTGTNRELERGAELSGLTVDTDGIEGMSVVIVCCAVGHAATNARPLMSRPVPRRTRAGSGRRAPGRPSRYTHNMPSSRRGRSARPGATPGEYALLDTSVTSTCSGATTRRGTGVRSDAHRLPGRRARWRSAPRQVCGADGSPDRAPSWRRSQPRR